MAFPGGNVQTLEKIDLESFVRTLLKSCIDIDKSYSLGYDKPECYSLGYDKPGCREAVLRLQHHMVTSVPPAILQDVCDQLVEMAFTGSESVKDKRIVYQVVMHENLKKLTVLCSRSEQAVWGMGFFDDVEANGCVLTYPPEYSEDESDDSQGSEDESDDSQGSEYGYWVRDSDGENGRTFYRFDRNSDQSNDEEQFYEEQFYEEQFNQNSDQSNDEEQFNEEQFNEEESDQNSDQSNDEEQFNEEQFYEEQFNQNSDQSNDEEESDQNSDQSNDEDESDQDLFISKRRKLN